MWLAHVLCSAKDCTEELELIVEELEELDGAVCDCGYGFVLRSLSEVELV
jgi:hypothetical protein